MADSKISELQNYPNPKDNDLIVIVDVLNFTTKKITLSDLDSAINFYSESLIGSIDGINKIFTTTFNYELNSTIVFINGLKQKLNISYFENGTNEIEFDEAPSDLGFEDDLFIIYKKGT